MKLKLLIKIQIQRWIDYITRSASDLTYQTIHKIQR